MKMNKQIQRQLLLLKQQTDGELILTSSNLGFSIKYPSPYIATASEIIPSKYDLDSLKPSVTIESGFHNFVLSINAPPEANGVSDIKSYTEIKKNNILNTDDGNHTIKLVEDVTPISFNGNTGYSFLVSQIDKNSKLSTSIGNITVISHNGKIYESIFNAPPSTYDISSNMLNDMLLSIEWLN